MRLGMGSRRTCYRLPGVDLCVKCYRSDEEIAEGKNPGVSPFKPLARCVVREIRRFRFDERRNTCCQEYRYGLELRERLPKDLMTVFPATMEQMFLPSYGWAVVEELIVNADGTSPRRFAQAWLVADAQRQVELTASFKALGHELARHSVRVYDPPNVLVQWLSDGSFRLRIMDFEPASRLFLPIDRIPVLVRFKIRRRFARYLRNWNITIPGGVA